MEIGMLRSTRISFLQQLLPHKIRVPHPVDFSASSRHQREVSTGRPHLACLLAVPAPPEYVRARRKSRRHDELVDDHAVDPIAGASARYVGRVMGAGRRAPAVVLRTWRRKLAAHLAVGVGRVSGSGAVGRGRAAGVRSGDDRDRVANLPPMAPDGVAVLATMGDTGHVPTRRPRE